MSIQEQFRALIDEFASQCDAEGVRLLPYREEGWQRFHSLTFEKQVEKVSGFLKFYQACAEVVDSGISLKRGVKSLEKVMSKFGYQVCPGLYDQISDEEVIEAYTSDFTQLFRNLEMLKLCSYSLLELSVYEWPELFRRPHSITEKLIGLAGQVLGSPSPRTITCSEVPNHFLEEIFSPDKHKLFIEQKLLSPLMDSSGATVGFIGTLRAHLFDPTTETGQSMQNVTPLSK